MVPAGPLKYMRLVRGTDCVGAQRNGVRIYKRCTSFHVFLYKLKNLQEFKMYLQFQKMFRNFKFGSRLSKSIRNFKKV